MNITTYFLIPLVLFVILLYPLVRKAVALLEILVNKQVQQTTQEKQANTSSTSQTLFNLKLLAYERIILFIERIKPDSFIPRTLSPSLPYQEYQLLLINEIRKEFEYNLSQQLYLSENAWEVTVNFIQPLQRTIFISRKTDICQLNRFVYGNIIRNHIGNRSLLCSTG